jgi:chromosome segregation ATPase
MKTTSFLIVLTFFFIAQLSFAQVYKWVDEKGAVHYTDDILQVPEKNRPTTERMGNVEEKSEPKVQIDASPSKKKEEPYKDRLGRGEEYWKERTESWKKKLASAQDKVEDLRMKYNDLTEKLNASKSSVERATFRNERDQVKNELDKYKQQVEEAKIMLDKKLPEEAQLYKAKPEWLKP